MRRGIASSIGALALLATALSGCVAGDDDAVFGPEDGEGALVGSAESLSVLFKAKPARGPAPLVVGFSIDLRGAEDPGTAWSIDFGNGSRDALGDRLPASASYNFTEVGSHEVTATVRTGDEATRSRLVVVVLPSDAPAADPDEEVEGETMPFDEEDDGDEGDDENGAAEEDETEGGGEDGGGTPVTSSESSSPTSGPSPSTSTSPSPASSPSSSSTTTANPPSASSTSTSAASTSTSAAPPPPSDNHPPQATLTATRTSGEAPLDVSFTIDASDPEGRAIAWTLDVRDDGSIEASGDRGDVPRTSTHRFDQPGTYVTTFEVTDGVSTTTRTVTVTAT